MKQPEVSFRVPVDVTNPGQFFACCGLLELAHRLWPGAEGWFDDSDTSFFAISGGSNARLECLSDKLRRCEISGPPGAEARKGKIGIGQPFDLILNWWQTNDDDPKSPKTWAGRQEVRRIARAAQKALPVKSNIFNYGAVLRKRVECHTNNRRQADTVEPFYFDARRFAHALDTGFSLDTQKAETTAHPSVELFCLIGLQRFRPAPSSIKWNFEYQTWPKPLYAPIASGVASCAVPMPGSKRYRFPLCFRDNQKRYKSFGFSTQLEVIYE